jgi:SAM-dependent methyltransferase
MDNHPKINGNEEVFHGQRLAQRDPERIWGWGTPAGKARAQRRADWISQKALLGPGKLIVEIGCGTGLFTEKFVQTGAQVMANDISSDLLAIAETKEISRERVRFIAGRFEDWEIAGPFDAIIGSSVLHHLDVKATLAKIRKLLKPGGIMVFAEPNMLNPIIILQKNIPWLKERMGDSPDETAFVRWGVKRLLESAGFSEIEIVPRDWLLPMTPLRWIPFLQKVEPYLERMPLIKEMAGSLYIKAVSR